MRITTRGLVVSLWLSGALAGLSGCGGADDTGGGGHGGHGGRSVATSSGAGHGGGTPCDEARRKFASECGGTFQSFDGPACAGADACTAQCFLGATCLELVDCYRGCEGASGPTSTGHTTTGGPASSTATSTTGGGACTPNDVGCSGPGDCCSGFCAGTCQCLDTIDCLREDVDICCAGHHCVPMASGESICQKVNCAGHHEPCTSDDDCCTEFCFGTQCGQ